MGIRSIASTVSLVAALSVGAITLAGCSTVAPPADSTTMNERSGSVSQMLDALNLDAADPKAMIETLDAMPVAERPGDLIVSVLPTSLRLQPGEPDEVSIPLSEQNFYLSIAPFVSETHPCTFHSLTTCLGELQNTPIELTVTDTASGAVVVSKDTTTADNGFVGVWLPRGGEFSVRIDSDQGGAEQTVKTGDEDPTCLTTLQLV